MKIYGNIRIRNLDYCWEERRILKNINLTVSKGEKVLLLGSTGSGKSTLLKILMKYFEVGMNQVFIDEVDINLIKKEILDEKVVYLDQNGTLFTDTLYFNILLNRKVSAHKFSEVMKLCAIDEIVKKRKLGYDTVVEENGFNFSGGEKARIMLARALLNSFEILLIDEGFHAMNIELEYQILKRLMKKYHDKTIIVVSHRRTSMDLFDTIYEIKNENLVMIS